MQKEPVSLEEFTKNINRYIFCEIKENKKLPYLENINIYEEYEQYKKYFYLSLIKKIRRSLKERIQKNCWGLNIASTDDWIEWELMSPFDKFKNDSKSITDLLPIINRQIEMLKKLDHKKIKTYIYTIGYSEYLTTAYWQWLSYITKKLFGATCVICNSDKNLNIHHRTYKYIGIEIVDIPKSLICLCQKCHTLYHINKKGEKLWQVQKN